MQVWAVLFCWLAALTAASPATPLCPPFTKYLVEKLTNQPAGVESWKLTGPGCHLHYFTQQELLKCQANKWVLFSGGSNGCSSSAQLAHVYMNLPYTTDAAALRNSRFNASCAKGNNIMHWFDVIVLADGKVKSVVSDTACNQILNDRSDFGPINMATMAFIRNKMIAAGTTLPPGAMRFTWVYSVKFPLVFDILTDLVTNLPGMPLPSFHSNIGVWYASIANFNTGLDWFLDKIRGKWPTMQIVLRDQSYSNDAMRASFKLYYDKYAPLLPNLILLHEGQYGPGFREIWMDWSYGNHPLNQGGLWVAHNYIQAVCSGFEEQTPVVYELFSSPITSGPDSRCNWSKDNYYEYVQRDCDNVIYTNVPGNNVKPACQSGQKNNYKWTNAQMAYQGSCTDVPCPANAAGAPNCACNPGYTDTLVWNKATETYTGSCTLAPCPANGEGPPNCKCQVGFSGSLSWNSNKWQGTCTIVACSSGAGQYHIASEAAGCSADGFAAADTQAKCKAGCESLAGSFSTGSWTTNPGCFYGASGALEGSCQWNTNTGATTYLYNTRQMCHDIQGTSTCGCHPGYSGSLVWDPAKQVWTGTCQLVACPTDSLTPATKAGGICACKTGYNSTVSWLKTTQTYTGGCTMVACPKFALGAPDCKCLDGHKDTVAWEPASGTYSGSCTLQSCPANSAMVLDPLATMAPECVCSVGYSGSITWNRVSQTWQGSCTAVTCPNSSTAEAQNAGCTCNIGFIGTIGWSKITQTWTGKCTSADCPTNSDGNPCQCVDGTNMTTPISFAAGKWKGNCTVIPCLQYSSGLPCKCATGYVDTVKWQPATNMYSGNCTVATCPSNSAWPPGKSECECYAGYSGSLVWSFQKNVWEGNCTLVPCPKFSSGALANSKENVCTCDAGYSGELTWSATGQSWAGSCSLLPCPAQAENGPNCTCIRGYQGALTVTPTQWNGTCELVKCPVSSTAAVPGDCKCQDGYSGVITWEDFPVAEYNGSCTLQPCPSNLTTAPNCTCPTGFAGYPTWNRTSQLWEGNCTSMPCPTFASGAPTDVRSLSNCQCDRYYSADVQWSGTGQKWVPAACVLEACPPFSTIPQIQNRTDTDVCVCSRFYSGTTEWDFASPGRWNGKCAKVECPNNSTYSVLSGCVCQQKTEGKLVWNETSQDYDGECTEARPLGLYLNDPQQSLRLMEAAYGPGAVNKDKSGYKTDVKYDGYHLFLLVSSVVAIIAMLVYPKIKRYICPKVCLEAEKKPPAKPDSKPAPKPAGKAVPDKESVGSTELVANPALAAHGSFRGSAGAGALGKLMHHTASEASPPIHAGSGPYPPPPPPPASSPISPSSKAKKGKKGVALAVTEYIDLEVVENPLTRGSAESNTTAAQGAGARAKAVLAKLGFHDPEEELWEDDGGDGFNIPAPTTRPAAKSVLFKQPARTAGARLDALGPARFLASVHIVAGHLVNKDPPRVPTWPTTGWGFTWVPFFMMLSAFILSYARAASSRPGEHQQPIPFLVRRLRSIYPLYLTGIFSAAAIDAYTSGKPFTLGTPWETISQLLLLQAWCPIVTTHVYQQHCWFLSCIIPYWLLHRSIYLFVYQWSAKKLLIMLGAITILPWLCLIIIPAAAGIDLEWYNAAVNIGKRGDLLNPVDIAVIMLKFHPFSYLPNYINGVCLGILFVRMGEKGAPPLLIKYGASIAYCALFSIFLLGPYVAIPAYKLSARLGVLAPLHGLLLFGLSAGVDPVSKFLGHKYLAFLGDVSFPQYIFQFIAYSIWNQTAGFDGIGFWTLLFSLSLAGSVFVDKKLSTAGSSRRSKLIGGSTVLLLPLVLVGIVSLTAVLPPHQLPGRVDYPGGMYDQRLNLSAADPELDTVSGAIINPSILPDPNNTNMLWVAARWHKVHVQHEFGIFPTEDEKGRDVNATLKTTMTWFSHVLIGRLHAQNLTLMEPMKRLRVSPPFNQSAEWLPCIPEYGGYQPVNNSVTQVLSVGGMEDPRLFWSNGQLALTFQSLPPQGTPDPNPAGGGTDSAGGARPAAAFDPTVCHTKGRLYKVVLPAWEALPPFTGPTVPASQAGNLTEKNETDGSDEAFGVLPTTLLTWERSVGGQTEKNWMVFPNPATPAEDLYVRSVVPHRVLKTSKTAQGSVTFVEVAGEFFSRLLVSKHSSTVFHGGANAVFMDGNSTGEDPYFLGTFHSINASIYRNYMYKFQAKAPFSITKISGMLPMLGAPVRDLSIFRPLAFNSGLTVLPSGDVLLSYGSSNAESRVLVIPRDQLPQFFLKDD